MNSVVRRSSEGTRALSPVAKSKENFSGQLVVLDKEKDGTQLGEIRWLLLSNLQWWKIHKITKEN